MLVALRSFLAQYDGCSTEVFAGVTRVAPDHALAVAFPDEFVTEDAHDAHRRSALVRQAARPGATEDGVTFHTPTRARTSNDPLDQAHEDGLRAIDFHSDTLTAQAADRLERVVRSGDPYGLESRYLVAVGDPDYNSAFGKLVGDPSMGHLRFTTGEQTAMQRVNAIEAERGLTSGTTTTGGFAIPFTLDPSVMLTSDGALNPIRSVAKVITITTREWKGVTSAGVTASYDAEAAEVSDDTPTLGQPTITTAMGRAFIPFSLEIGMDWAGMQDEMARLISDGRDTLDATKFLTGSGTDEPAGVITGLTTTQRVLTAGTASYAIADVYSLKEALPSRFVARASWAANPSVLDTTYRFVGGGSSEPAVLPTREGPMLGKGVTEWSTMQSGITTTGHKLAIYGDWQAGYTIADRIGMTVELVPHLFGGSGRPTGQRGVFAYWRTGAKVVNVNALRYLEVK
jgi:HK97 family phage major capsid protein